MQETFNSVDPANPETFSLLLLPDAASLLRVHFWACFTLEVCGKLGLIGEGNICPPRSREVAIKALGGSCQVNSSKKVFAYRPCVLQKIFIADIPRAQRAPVKSVTQLKWNIILGRNFYLLSPRKAGLKWSWSPGHIAFWLPATFGRHGTLPGVESAFMYTYSCVDFCTGWKSILPLNRHCLQCFLLGRDHLLILVKLTRWSNKMSKSRNIQRQYTWILALRQFYNEIDNPAELVWFV